MFIQWQNSEGNGINLNNSNYSLSLNYIEDFSSEEYVVKNIDYLTNQMHSDFIFAPFSKDLTRACANQASLSPSQPIIMSSGTFDTSVFASFPNMFGTLAPEITMSDTAFSFMRQLSQTNANTKVAIISDMSLSTCSNSSLHELSLKYNVPYDYYSVDSNSVNYVSDLTSVLQSLNSEISENNENMIVYGCSEISLCVNVSIYIYSKYAYIFDLWH
jgi:hypothetical protein